MDNRVANAYLPCSMDATLILKRKQRLAHGLIIEMVIWRLPRPVPGSAHPYKYRLFFGKAGQRLIGYDNERGKGDHRHQGGQERPYTFTSLDQLRADFWRDVNAWRATAGHDGDGRA